MGVVTIETSDTTFPLAGFANEEFSSLSFSGDTWVTMNIEKFLCMYSLDILDVASWYLVNPFPSLKSVVGTYALFGNKFA